MVFRAQKEWFGTSYLISATSEDGIGWKVSSSPIFYPDLPEEIPGGCEDPRLVKIGSMYYLTYTSYDGKHARLCMATSGNLRDWKKYGPIIPQMKWSKSGAIIPTEIDGKFWMYFGDSYIWAAHSYDLISWEIDKKRDIVLAPRSRMFDSLLVEPGPPPIVTEDFILLFYNGADRNRRYYVAWAVFSREDPLKPIARAETPLMFPEFDWEKYGQVNNVCFAESFVVVDNICYLFYGAADTYIGLAKANTTPTELYVGSPGHRRKGVFFSIRNKLSSAIRSADIRFRI